MRHSKKVAQKHGWTFRISFIWCNNNMTGVFEPSTQYRKRRSPPRSSYFPFLIFISRTASSCTCRATFGYEFLVHLRAACHDMPLQCYFFSSAQRPRRVPSEICLMYLFNWGDEFAYTLAAKRERHRGEIITDS